MLADIEHADVEVRAITVANLAWHPITVDQAILYRLKAATGTDRGAQQDDCDELSLLEKAKQWEPGNAEWPFRIGYIYYNVMKLSSCCEDGDSRYWAAESLAELERALDLDADEERRGFTLFLLPRIALDAGEHGKAGFHAQQLLDRSALFREIGLEGDAVHCGHLVLGRLALAGGDVGAAKVHLLASAVPEGSGALSSFGPNLSLARDLLAHGETAVVLRYLGHCRRFWDSGVDDLKNWTEQIEQGQIPDFGANLVY